MKRILLTLLAIAISTIQMLSQTPLGFNYQALVRSTNGQLITNKQIGVRISLLQGGAQGTLVYRETFRPTTNSQGLFSIAIGRGTASVGAFSSIDWSPANFHLRVEVDPTGGTNYTDMGTTQLLSVPYANYAFAGARGKSAYEVWLSRGNVGSEIDFIKSLRGPRGVSSWAETDTTITTSNRVGIGTNQTTGSLQVEPSVNLEANAPLFQITNSEGKPILSIYENLIDFSSDVNIVITDGDGAKSRGGFAVSGRTSTKEVPLDLLVVEPSQTTFYVDESKDKSRGGFAVSGRTSTKGEHGEILWITPQMTQIFINDSLPKSRGGFAVSGRTSTKATPADILTVTPNLTQVFVSEGISGKSRGGFAVSGRTSTKEGINDILWITPDFTQVYVDEDGAKSRGGFAVSGRTSTKGVPVTYFSVTPSLTEIYIDSIYGGKSRGGFAVSGRTSTKSEPNDILWITPDFTRVYVDEAGTKSRGGFAVSGRTSTKGEDTDIFSVTPALTQVFVNETIDKSRGGFTVSGRTSTKEDGLFDILTVRPERTDIYLKTDPSKFFPDGFGIFSYQDTTEQEDDTKELFSVSQQSGTQVNTRVVVAPRLAPTHTATSITQKSAWSGGIVLDDGNEGESGITARGLVYSTSPNPNLSMGMANPYVSGRINDAIAGNGLGNFELMLNHLQPGTTFNVRAFATNAEGLTGYGTAMQFRTLNPDTVTLTILNHYTLSTIPNATISFTPAGYNVPITNPVGEYRMRVAKDTYSIVITAAGYEDYTGNVTVTGNMQLDVTLTPRTTTVTLNVTNDEGFPVDGALVAISLNQTHQISGVTANGVAVITGVPQGSWPFTITSANHSVFNSHFTASHTSALVVNVTLIPIKTVTFKVFNSANMGVIGNAIITLNGVRQSIGSYLHRLIKGEYTYIVERPGYISQSGTFTVSSDMDVEVLLVADAVPFHLVTLTQVGAGQILPSTVNWVAHGENLMLTFLASAGYSLADVSVNGTSIGAVGSYTITSIVADMSVNVIFTIRTYQIDASSGPNGSIVPAGTQFAEHGSSQRFQILPNEGFVIEDVTLNGISVKNALVMTGNNGELVLENVINNHTLIATFAAGAIPTLNTYEPTLITSTSVISGGFVLSEGSTSILDRGIVWSSLGHPTLDLNEGISRTSPGTGTFTLELTGLEPYTTYYVRAFATNASGTGYGEELVFTTQKGELTISGSFTVSSKPYDGSTSATILTNSLSISPVNGSHAVSLAAVATFADSAVGVNKLVSLLSSTLGGVDAHRYILSFVDAPETYAGINPKELTLDGTFSVYPKEYSGDIVADIYNNSLTLIGIVGSEDVFLVDGMIGFSTSEVGTGITVTIIGVELGGTHKDNYTVSLVGAPTTTGDIYAKELTVSGFSQLDSKEYDGNTQTSVTGTPTLNGLFSGDEGLVGVTVNTANFYDPSAGFGKPGVVTFSLSGPKSGNYTVTDLTSLAGDITPKEVTIGGTFIANDRIYYRSTSATIATNSLFVDGKVGTDDVSLYNIVLEFASKNVGTDIQVSIIYAELIGFESMNYTLSLNDAPTSTASITPKTISVFYATVEDKIYDGTTIAEILGAEVPGVENGDDVTLQNHTIGEFAQAGVGTNIPVTTSMTISGADAINYKLTQPIGLLGNIIGYIITATAGDNGSIDPVGGISAAPNAYLAFTFTPDASYHVADVTVDGSSVLPMVMFANNVGSYQLMNITSNQTIHATFAVDAVPTVTTTVISNIGPNAASSGGIVVDENGSPVTQRGIVWSASENPTVEVNHGITFDGAGVGSFVSQLNNLTLGLTYYVRAYATNSVGTSYGEELTFTTDFANCGTVTDIDGNTYTTIVIGDQCWLRQNLRTTKYKNNDPIENLTYSTWGGTNGAYAWFEDDISNKEPWGAYYNHYAVMDNRGICPAGWDIPSSTDFQQLITLQGGSSQAGSKLKTTGSIAEGDGLWISNNLDATNESGFSAIPAGRLEANSITTGSYANIWTNSTIASYGSSFPVILTLYGDSPSANLFHIYYDFGVSVRCINLFGRAVVNTGSITNLSTHSVSLTGSVSNDGGEAILARGVIWHTSPEPTILDYTGMQTHAQNEVGEFNLDVTGLAPSTNYYYRAYATNSRGTHYGEVRSFSTFYGTVTDHSNNTYYTTRIGSQVWMAENLRATDFPTVSIDKDVSLPSVTPSWAAYDDSTDPLLISSIGLLYNKHAAVDSVCPTGWRIPTDNDWKLLELSIGIPHNELNNTSRNTDLATKLKDTNPVFWQSSYTPATNDYNFFARGAGYLSNTYFYSISQSGLWWTNTEIPNNPEVFYIRRLNSHENTVLRETASFDHGLSIRCVLSPPTPTVFTIRVLGVTTNSSTIEYEVPEEGESAVTQMGVCYSTSPNPTIDADNFTVDDLSTGTISTYLTSLTPNTTYYVRAYATNASGTAYGNQIEFPTASNGITHADWESGAIAPEWHQGGKGWVIDPGMGFHSNHSVRAAPLAPGETATLSIFFESDQGVLSFMSTIMDPNISSYMELYINNQWAWARHSEGDGGWSNAQIPVNAGYNEFKWVFRVNTMGESPGTPNAWIDNIVFPSNAMDIEGNLYRTVTIGNQLWMAENLRVTKYNNGDPIPTGLENSAWEGTSEGAYTIYPHDSIAGLNSDQEVLEAYGALYNWYAVSSGNLCPVGWHVPSFEEWGILIYQVSLEYPDYEGMALKSTSGWNNSGNGTDIIGFGALPGGNRSSYGSFSGIGNEGAWWSSSMESSNGIQHHMLYNSSGIGSQTDDMRTGNSVRCVQNPD